MSRQDKIERIKVTEIIVWYFALWIALFLILPIGVFKIVCAVVILANAATGIYIYFDLKRISND